MIWKVWKKAKMKSEKIWKIWKKVKLNSEMICKIQKKSKLNSEMIWTIWNSVNSFVKVPCLGNGKWI
jgi:hypothetical protein